MAEVIPIQGRRRGARLAPGQRFAGRYHLLRRLGRGGMGEVWTAIDEKVHRRVVALKILHPRLLEVPGYRARFEHESLALTNLPHPYLVPLYDWGTEPQPFIVMKWVAGVTLRDLLREHGRLPWVQAACFAVAVAGGLWAMHRSKVWHRDVKPENLMVDEDGNITILDLGIARDAAESGPGEITDRVGTRGYLPPEMILRRPTDHRGDLYQLGVVLYELLTGHKPFRDVDETSDTEVQAAHVRDPPEPIRPEVPGCPEALEKVVMRLLAKDPADRYPTASHVSSALAQVLRDHGSVPPGDDLEQMVLRVLVRRRLDRMAEASEIPDEDDAPGEDPPIQPDPPAEHDVPRSPRTCGFYPAAVVPALSVPVRTVELPRAAVPPMREPFPLAKPRIRTAEGARVVPMAGLAMVVALAVVLAVVAASVTVWALGARTAPSPEAPAAPRTVK
jgi:serine/threonine protein kinase